MRTDTEGSPSVAEEKSSAVPHFRSGRRSLIFAGLTNKGKVGVQRGRETAGVPSFLPLRRAPQRPRRPQTANPPAEVQRKTSRPLGANTLTQFARPGQPVQEKEPPRQGEHANAVRAPRLSGAGKRAALSGRTRLRSSCAPAFRCRKKRRTQNLTAKPLQTLFIATR